MTRWNPRGSNICCTNYYHAPPKISSTIASLSKSQILHTSHFFTTSFAVVAGVDATLRIALLPSDHVVLFPRKTDGTHVLWRDGSPATQTAVCSLTIAGIAQNRRRQSEYVVEGNCGPGALHFNYKGSHSVKHPGP